MERPVFEQIRAAMPANLLHRYLTFQYESGCRPGATKRIIWQWVNLDTKEISLPAYVVKTKKPIIFPLSDEAGRHVTQTAQP